MGIINSIIRSNDDLVKPDKKSYWGYDFTIELHDVKKIREKFELLPTEKRLVAYELSGKEPVTQAIIIKTIDTAKGRLTTSQIKDMLDDMGFNVDTILSGGHFSDISAVMNINGYVIPGWEFFAHVIERISPHWKKLLLTKLAPGRDRLHVRVFEMNDGTWLILAHTDWNWITLNIYRIYKAHIATGTGNFKLGTFIMYHLLKKFRERLAQNRRIKYGDILKITRTAYYQSFQNTIMRVKK